MSITEEYTTRIAARILGISVTSVQKLVESGALTGWKTKGGHRRILLTAIDAYKLARASNEVALDATSVAPASTILIVLKKPTGCEYYNHIIGPWNLNVTMLFCDNSYHALIEIGLQKPDILLIEVAMADIENCQLIKAILTYPDLSDMQIALLLKGESEQSKGVTNLPDDVVFLANDDQLRGYLSACCAQQARHRSKRIS